MTTPKDGGNADDKKIPDPNKDGADDKDKDKDKDKDERIAKADHEAALARARQQEKDKLYPDLEKARKASEEATAALEAANVERAALEAKIKAAEDEKLSESEKLTKRLEEQKAEIASLTDTVNATATAAEQNLAKYRVDMYRERKLRSAGLTVLADTVTGATEAEVDVQIASAAAKEKALIDKGAAAHRKELGDNVPGPVGYANSGNHSLIDGKSREEIAKMPPDEYKKFRQVRLQRIQQGA